ncbi:MAG: ATP-binding protein [Oligoflexia bacterium]|nr:ATP-binding protein [Oligoflexia bacterium]
MSEKTKKDQVHIETSSAAVEVPTLESTTRELKNIRHALDKAAILAITDQAGTIIHVNDKFCEISKYSREELLGKNHRIINSGYHTPEFFVNMWKTIASGKIWEGEIKNRAKDGSFYWVNTTIVPFLNEKGRPYEYVSIRYEITQRKVAEEQLRIYADRLEHSNRELQDFASIAAHDLQEPLRKIQAFGDRLKTKFDAQLSDEGRDYLERMLSSARRMRKLIDDLLTYSRVTTKAQPFVATDLNQVLSDVLSDLELRIEQVKGKVVHKDPLPTLDADPSQMRQLFQNLISNALKFHKKDISPVVEISVKLFKNHCILSVADNGIGFDEKYLDKIFTIFQRLHGRQEYEGTGVGLAVCRRIAERHEGTITAQSTPGEGACFHVTLPLKH